MYGEYRQVRRRNARGSESSPHVRGIRFLARVITPPIRIPHSLCVVDESRIFLDGDPQASYLTFLVLAC